MFHLVYLSAFKNPMDAIIPWYKQEKLFDNSD